ncbi:RES family NAD+ phosphorylase [Pseudomonas guariconensis]|uniref:RES family NAD+ phosphorylase n=1 Tax=Pseudomonas guariconensis TaxID=1288410 RepID=UPI00397C17C9
MEALGPPPGRSTRANRMNSSGVSVFYGAREARSALAEVRPVVGSKVVVAKFSITRSLQLLDLRVLGRLTCRGSVFDPTYGAELERQGFLRILSRRLVLPVMPSEQDHAYLITQAVADYLSSQQSPTVDGIIFSSVQDGVGVNVVLFHKASLVEPLGLPKETRLSAEVEDFDHEAGTAYPSYWLQVDKPTDLIEETPSLLPHIVSWDWDTHYAKYREPALRLELEAISVHAIKAVEVKDEVQEVTVSYGTYDKRGDSAFDRF